MLTRIPAIMPRSSRTWFRCSETRCLRCSFLVYLVGMFLLSVIWFTNRDDAKPNTDFAPKTIHPPVKHLNHEEKLFIVNWRDLGSIRDYDITCNSLRCHVTTDHKEWHNHDVLGIIFYGSTFGLVGLPLPRKRGHLWSIIHEESPRNNHWLFSATDAMSLFNLTGTFKRESHYPFPTMWIMDERNLKSTEFVVSIQKKNQLRRDGLAPIVFVHMDCHVPSDRSHYMRMLNKHIQIDSYGNCEHNTDFPMANVSFNSGTQSLTSKHFYKILAQYKFAFAIENAVCDDYITEKFWRPLHLGVVPLVFGSPKIKDFVPSDHSIIDIRDFRSVKEVAEYITFLDTHDDEYSKYLDFKRTGITNPKLKVQLERRDFGRGKPHGTQFDGFDCFVCEQLHIYKQQVATGQTMDEWRGEQDHFGCPEPKVFDEDGRYVLNTKGWSETYNYAEYYFQSLRFHINNNIDADNNVIHKYANYLQKKVKKIKKLKIDLVSRLNRLNYE